MAHVELRFAPERRIPRYLSHLGTCASTVALLMAFASVTPSLIPRGWAVQGVVTGLSLISGYAVGSVLAWFGHRLDVRRWFSVRVRTASRWVLAAMAVVVTVAMVPFGVHWQNDARRAIGMDLAGAGAAWTFVLVPVVALVVAVPLLALARLVRALTQRVARLLAKGVHARVAQVVAVVVVGALAWGLLSGVLWTGILRALNGSFAAAAASFDPGLDAPTAAERSGSSASHESWESLGREGRRFVTGGPTVQQIQSFEASLPSGGVAAAQVAEPIRAYSGLEGGIDHTAEQVVDELDRTNAWDRADLLVVTTTGSGWVDSSMADSFELMHGGNTAIAAMQYSNLPSWLSFVGDRTQPAEAGKALFEAVYARWSQLPADHRPHLYVAGISLGSYGMQSAFSGPQDVAARTDGALFVGTPNFTPLWADVTSSRDAGSREVAPVYQAGAQARFLTGAVGQPGDPLLQPGAWAAPRTVFAQHGSDGVTWWSPALLWSAPDWLREPRASDVSSATRWFPVSTFWQLTSDMFFAASGDVPRDAGHHFELEYADGFAAISAPDGWTTADTQALRTAIAQRDEDSEKPDFYN
jgi:uncharacterized membrane protein